MGRWKCYYNYSKNLNIKTSLDLVILPLVYVFCDEMKLTVQEKFGTPTQLIELETF